MPYTPHETTELLGGIPDSTLRRLATEFEPYLSKRRGRKRSYTARDIETLRLARDYLARGLTYAQAREKLSAVVDMSEEPPEETPTIPESRQLARLDNAFQELNSELDRLRAGQESDHGRLERLEAWFRLPWWKRLFSRPPD